MKHIILMVAVGLMTISTVASQDKLTGEDYRQIVANYSLRLKMSKEQTSAANDQLRATKSGYYPSLALAANASHTLGNDIMLGATQLKEFNYGANLTLQQNIYTGNSVRNKSRAAGVEADIALVGEKNTLQNVLYNADLVYLSAAAAYEQLLVMDRYVDIVDDLYKVVDNRFKDGYVSRTDLLMVETRLNEARMNQISARKLYQNNLQQLNTTMGADPLTDYKLDTLSLPITVINAPLEKILQDRADYVIADKKIDLAAANIRVAKSRFNPQLLGGIQGIYGTPQLNLTGEPKGYGAAYMQLSVPILMWGERRFTVSAVKATQRSAVLARQEMQDQIQGEVARARIDMTQTYEQAQIAGQNVRVAGDNLELNTFSYSEGRLPILDVLQSQLAWIQSYTNLVLSTRNYMVSTIDYRKAVGQIE